MNSVEKEKSIGEILLEMLPKQPDDQVLFWSNGDEILCKTADGADTVADLLEACGIDCAVTGYYDPDEDQRSGEVDSLTGWHYVNW